MAPLEAMASGVPVVATDTGFFSTFIGDNEAGILVRELDPEKLFLSAQSLIDNPVHMQQKSKQARIRAVTLFGLESEVEGVHRVYEDLWA